MIKQLAITFVAVLVASAMALSISGAAAYTYIQRTADQGVRNQLVYANRKLREISQKLGECSKYEITYGKASVCAHLKKIREEGE